MTIALVEGVEDGAPAGGAAGDQAVGPEHGLSGDAARPVELAHGLAAVVEEVGARPRVGLLPPPQAITMVARMNS